MEGSIYFKARQEWDERYADLVLGKRNWQITAAGMMAITLVLAFGMVWVSTRSKFVPYVVEVDKLGYAIGAPSALTENTSRISTDRMVRYERAMRPATPRCAELLALRRFPRASTCGYRRCESAPRILSLLPGIFFSGSPPNPAELSVSRG